MPSFSESVLAVRGFVGRLNPLAAIFAELSALRTAQAGQTIQLATIQQKLEGILVAKTTLDDILAEVQAENTLTQSVLTLLGNISLQLEAAGTDQAKLDQLKNLIDTNMSAMAAAVSTNTPAAGLANVPSASEQGNAAGSSSIQATGGSTSALADSATRATTETSTTTPAAVRQADSGTSDTTDTAGTATDAGASTSGDSTTSANGDAGTDETSDTPTGDATASSRA